MARAEDTEVIEAFEQFYRDYYRNEIGELAQRYPNEQRSLYVDWGDLYRYDPDLADDFIAQPEQMRDYAEEALRLYDLPVDVKLGQAHVRIQNLQESTSIREIRARHRGQLIAVSGIVRKATDVRPKITEAAFECQRCGTLSRIPQTSGEFHEPHECQGCERQGPFNINFDQSEFVDAQKLRIQESPEGLRGGETPQSIDVHIEDDVTGEVTAGDHVRVTGILHLDQQGNNQEKSPIFDVYMDGLSVEIEDEQFEDMDITDEDKKKIIELSGQSEIYEKMVGSMAPSIYGYDQEKLAIIMQLFSGVTKELPDGSRIRGDLHMLLIGDPGTGKCVSPETRVTLADGSEREIGALVEAKLDDPKPVDDGVYDEVSFQVPSLASDGRVVLRRATRVWKRQAPERMYRIRTESGRELEATPSHPLFSPSAAGITATKAAELSAGEFIAVPRQLPTVGDDSLDVSFRRSEASDADRVEPPETLTPKLARLLGYLVADGHVEQEGVVRIASDDRAVLDDAAAALDDLGVSHDRELVCRSGELVRFLREIEPTIPSGSAEQRVPAPVLRATRPVKRGFLRAFVDTGGVVSPERRSIVVESSSKELLEGIRSLLLSFGIDARRRERSGGRYRLRIDRENFTRYVEEIGFVTDRKASPAAERPNTAEDANRDVVPNVGNALCTLRESFGLTQGDCGLPTTTYRQYECGDRNPSRESLRTILDAFTAASDDGVAADGGTAVEGSLASLRSLTREGVGWDRIVSIESVEPAYDWVYDLEVEGTHSYVSNNVLSHNSQLLQYVRNLAPRSVYTSGKGSSSAGLTAAAVRDDFGDGQQWTLEAGALVLADQGIAAVDELDKMRCVTGDTLVHLADGRVSRIRDLALEAAESGEIEPLENGRTIRDVDLTAWTMTDDGRLVERSVTAVHEYDAPERLTEVTLESGESVVTTPDHPFFVFEDGERRERAAEELDADDWVYVPRRLSPSVTDGGTVTAATAVGRAEGSSSSAFGRVLGYLSGSGNVYYNDPDGRYGLEFIHQSEALLADFENACRKAFSAEPVRYPSEQREDGVGTVRLRGREYADQVLDAGTNLETCEEEAFPAAVSEADRNTKAAFIRAMADSEGGVDTASGNVTISSTSEELLVGIKSLLLEFGISCQIQTRERSGDLDLHELVITAADSIRAFEREIGFTLERKQSALETVCASVDGDRTGCDVLPECGELLAQVRESLRLYQSECGLAGSTYCSFEDGEANISLQQGETVLTAFEDRIDQAESDTETLSQKCDWSTLERLTDRYHVSQAELADGRSFSQQRVSEHWGRNTSLREAVRRRLREIVSAVARTEIDVFADLITGDVKWRRVSELETVEPNYRDDRIPIFRREIAKRLACGPDEAEKRAEDVLQRAPKIDSWATLRGELERHEIHLEALVDDLGVASSTIPGLISGVGTDRFDDLKAAAEDRISEKRDRIRTLLERIEDRSGPNVYDLTVAGTHNFVANGMVVHNSEDRSAMHEALEQQSYHPDTEILLADGRRVEIGEFVDERMAAAGTVVDGVDCEILPVDDLTVHSVDFETDETTKLPVDRLSRHEAPDEFVRVKFSNGREVTVTPEHPMFVDEDGRVETVEARDIETGAFVPAPRKLPNSTATVEFDAESHVSEETGVTLPGALSGDLAELLGFLATGGSSYAEPTHEISFSTRDERTLDRIDELVNSVFGVESTDAVDESGTVSKRWVSADLYRWFESNVPELICGAHERRIPARVLGASEETIRRFLVGAFAAAGSVESEATLSAGSKGLAEDYADALSKVGIASRLRYDDAEGVWNVYATDESTERFVDRIAEPSDEPRRADVSERRCGLRRYRVCEVEAVPNEGENACEWVYDVTVEPTNTFVSKGVVLHNSISISKAGINATLKSRCSLLGAANPKYGRFDQYEPIGEQIDLEPALVSRFDLIFTVTDQPDQEEDAALADHIIQTNYAGELNTHREQTATSNVTREEVENVTESVEPEIEAELLRKYIAYAKRNCFPTMTEEAKEAIRDFYVTLRAKGQDEDAPVPVTARKLEALVRLSEASARMRLSDTVEAEDAERVINIVRSCLQDIGVDPETGEFDADVVETGRSKTQRDRIKDIKSLISEIESEYDEGAPVDEVLDRAEEMGLERSKAEHEIEKLRQKGDVYEPRTDHLRTV